MRGSRWLGVLLLVTLLGLVGLVGLALPAAVQAQATSIASPAGVVARLSFADPADLQRLVTRYDVWQVDHDTRMVTVWLTAAELRVVQTQSRRVIIDQAATDNTRAAQAAVQATQSVSGIPGYPCYRTVEETYAALTQLAAAYPTLVREVTLGQSWAWVNSGGSAGYPIPGLVLTNQAISGPKPIFFLMGAIHAREYTTAETAMRFAEQMVRSYGSDPDATWLLDSIEIHVVPQANPDGRKKAEAGILWRKNTNNDLCTFDPFNWGVDLNRNSSFKWGQCSGFNCSSSSPCNILYRGSAAASEPETQALENYLRTIFPDVRGPLDGDAAPAETSGLMISLHSYFPKILFPWGWTQSPAPNGAALQTLARKFGYYTGYAACQSSVPRCIYLTDGTTDDFAYGELGVAAFTFELGNTFFESCPAFESSILTPTLASLTYAAKAAVQPYVTPAGPEVVTATLSAALVSAGASVMLTATADDSRFFSGGFGDEPVQAIQAMRFVVDSPSWTPCAAHRPLAPADGAFDNAVELAHGVIDTQELAPGRHLLWVDAQDSDGVWGVPTGVFLDITDAAGNPPGTPYTPFMAPCNVVYLPLSGY